MVCGAVIICMKYYRLYLLYLQICIEGDTFKVDISASMESFAPVSPCM